MITKGLIKRSILGINVTTNTKNEILEYIEKYLLQSRNSDVESQKSIKKSLVITTPNPEQVVLAQKDQRFREILNQADVVIPDGIGLVIASQFLKSQIPNVNVRRKLKRISGVELMEDLVGMVSKQSIPVALIGGRVGVAVKALECLRVRFPGLIGYSIDVPELVTEGQTLSMKNISSVTAKISTLHSHFSIPPDVISLNAYITWVVKTIQQHNVRVAFIGLGAPKQEYFIERLKIESLKLMVTPLVLMSVGGSFDEISGRLPRPPVLIDNLGFKWLWRLFFEPWRWKRQLALFRFLWLVFKKRFFHTENTL